MRNLRHHSGVYSNMLRLPFLLICCLSAVAQPLSQREPLDLAIQNSWQARNENRPDDFATAREQARTLLQNARMDSPRYQGWVQQVASLYQSSGLNRQAREILQGALARTAPLGPNDPLHVAMETALGEAWLQDGNLLKALSYLEQAAAAQAAAPPPAPAPQSAQRTIFVSTGAAFGRFNSGSFNQAVFAYTRLADLYRQLGRPDSVAAVTAKIITLAATDQAGLARFYDQRGQLAEAAVIYRKLGEQAIDPQAKADAWQSLASIEQRQEQFSDAAAAMKEAIAAVESSGNPGVRAQTVWMRQNLANYLRQAGQTDQADQVYGQLLQESGSGPQATHILNAYAMYLAETKRAAQGEGLLKEYLDGNAGLDPQQKSTVLYGLASLSQREGFAKAAEEYQKQAQALQPQPPRPAGQVSISEDVQRAQTALTQRRFDDAFAIAGRVLDTAPFAADGQQVQWFIPQAALQLASNQQAARGEQLYQRLFALAETWKPNSAQALLTTSQNYAQFLMNQKDRLSAVPNAIDRYRDLLIEQNGSDSATVLQALRMKLEFELRDDQRQVKSSAHDLLESQEALTGTTSEPYLHDLQTAARAYNQTGESTTAAGLLRQAIQVADLISNPLNDWNRTQARMEAAWALVNLKQFDEAETWAQEAVALAHGQPRTPQLQNLSAQLEQIRQMKRSAAASAQR